MRIVHAQRTGTIRRRAAAELARALRQALFRCVPDD
jgi:hypothetical protein